MATIFRGFNRQRIEPLSQLAANPVWTNGRNNSLFATISTAVPFYWTGWQNPTSSYIRDSRVYITDIPQRSKALDSVTPPDTSNFPSMTETMPVPWGRQPSIDTRTWVSSGLALQTAGPNTKPFLQTEFPNPKGPQYPVGNLTHTYCDIRVLGVANTKPFNQMDFPNPRGPGYPVSNLTWIDQDLRRLSVLNTKPFLQTHHPVPTGYLYPIGLRTFVYSTINTQAPPPFNPGTALDVTRIGIFSDLLVNSANANIGQY